MATVSKPAKPSGPKGKRVKGRPISTLITSRLMARRGPNADGVPALNPGDHLDRKTFHERYEAMPEDFRAELIGGLVIVPSPASLRHGKHHGVLTGCLFTYASATSGVSLYVDTTVFLGPDSEPQPDGMLVIDPELGGQTWVEKHGDKEYLAGPPELAAEVAYSSEAYDLHSKYRDYEKAGVREYLVVVLGQPQRAAWFVRRGTRLKPLAPGPAGILRSEAFPGLWLDPAALLRADGKALLKTLQQGLDSPEHVAFVQNLAQRKRRSRKR